MATKFLYHKFLSLTFYPLMSLYLCFSVSLYLYLFIALYLSLHETKTDWIFCHALNFFYGRWPLN